ncbi:MAG: GNAT family N-acetyltransferase [Rubrivivax sp.]|nr:GNAT family N-acetyltransferase [Rubrivivax sp.]
MTPATSAPLRIERLDPRDLARATQIHAVLVLAHAQETRWLGLDPPAPLRRTRDDIQASAEFVLVALGAGDDLIGVLCLGPDDEADQICITTLVVRPDRQRQGIASLLLDEAVRRVDGAALAVAAAAGNAPALALYQSFGFVEIRRGSLGPGALEMLKLRRAGDP